MKQLSLTRVFWVGFVMLNAEMVAAQSYPTKPIRLVTTEVGGGSDLSTRVIAQGIAGPLGQPVIVDNRGGGGTITGEIVSRAAPDGYTLLVASNTLWVGALLRKTPYDALRDFSPITLAVSTPNLLVVHPSLANSVKELIAVAKAKPGQLNYGSGATGASSHLAAELFKSMAGGLSIVRISYKGSGLAVNAVVSNEVQMMFPNASIAAPHVKSGRLKALAVTSGEPSPSLPGVPTVAASGLPGYESVLYAGVLAPARTPAAIIKRLNHEIVQFLQTPVAKDWFVKSGGLDPIGSTPEQFTAKIKTETVRLGKLIKEVGIRAD